MIIPGKLDKNIKKKGRISRGINRPIYGSIKFFSSNNLTPSTGTKMTDNQLLFIKCSFRKISEKELAEMKKIKVPKCVYGIVIFLLLLVLAFPFIFLFSVGYGEGKGLFNAIKQTIVFFIIGFGCVGSVIHMNAEETRFDGKTKPEYYILNNYSKTKFEHTLDDMVKKYGGFGYYYEKTYIYGRVMHSEFIINALRTRINDKSEFSIKLFAAVCRLALFIRLTKKEVKFLRSICVDNIHDKIVKPIPYNEVVKIMGERFQSDVVNKKFQDNIENLTPM